jgi:hypothetical protein
VPIDIKKHLSVQTAASGRQNTGYKCLFYPGKGLNKRSKGFINPHVYGCWYRRAVGSLGAFVRQPCSARTWDEKQTRPFDESQMKTSSRPSSRQEEHTFVVRPPHTTQFLCARDACYFPSLSLFLFLVGVEWGPMPDVGVS